MNREKPFWIMIIITALRDNLSESSFLHVDILACQKVTLTLVICQLSIQPGTSPVHCNFFFPCQLKPVHRKSSRQPREDSTLHLTMTLTKIKDGEENVNLVDGFRRQILGRCHTLSRYVLLFLSPPAFYRIIQANHPNP